jgi:hypothetical protein
LERTGQVYFDITEDSDVLPLGCKRIFTKMDKSGYGYGFDRLQQFLNQQTNHHLVANLPFCATASSSILPSPRTLLAQVAV